LSDDDLARRRHQIHIDHGNCSRRFYADPMLEDHIGVVCERAFAERYGLSINEKILAEGDDHYDFLIRHGTLDVKGAQKAYNLLVKEWEIDRCADFLVLARWEPGDIVTFLGWEKKETMQRQPKKDFGRGIVNHYLSRHKLRPMSDLEQYL